MNHSSVHPLAVHPAVAWLSLALLCIVPPAAAMEASRLQVGRADVQKLCSGVRAGGVRVASCLDDNDAQVSPGCRAAAAG